MSWISMTQDDFGSGRGLDLACFFEQRGMICLVKKEKIVCENVFNECKKGKKGERKKRWID